MDFAAITGYLAGLPLSVFWNFIMLMFFSLQLLIKNIRRAWDPRTWLTIFFFYFIGSLAITFLVQIPLDVLLLLLTGRTLIDWIPATGSWLADHAIASFVNVFIFTILLSRVIVWLMIPAEKAKIFRRDVLESIVEYNNEYISSKLRKTAIIVIIGIILYFLL